MKIWILSMVLFGPHDSLLIGAYSTEAKCEAQRPLYDRPYSFGICQTLIVESEPRKEQ